MQIKKLNITVILLLLMIPIANAQNEFKSLLDSKSVTVGTRKINGGDAWKENGTLHFDPTAKEKQSGRDLVTDKEYSNFHLKLD
jgi:hypothetical protein